MSDDGGGLNDSYGELAGAEAGTEVQTVAQVQAGFKFTLMLTRSGELLASGCNEEGRCGSLVSHEKNVELPVLTDLDVPIARLGAGRGLSLRVGEFGNARVVLLLTADGALYSYGSAAYEQLGYPAQTRFTTRPQRVPFPAGCSVVQAAAGASHCLAVDALGYVFAWGRNHKGQCGLAADSPSGATEGADGGVVTAPTLLPGLPKMAACCAGDGFSVLVGADGDVCVRRGGVRRRFGCGDNAEGQLGFQSAQDTSPLVRLPVEFKVAQAAAGATHTVLLSAEGEVYFSGKIEGLWKTSFVRVLSREQGEVRSVHAAGGCCAALLGSGEVYVWGDNSCQQLGPGPALLEQPTLLAGATHVTQCSLGATHLVLLEEAERPNDLLPVVSPLSEAEHVLLESWRPENLIAYHGSQGSRLGPRDAASLLLSYLSQSNETFFSRLHQFERMESVQFGGCFLPHVTEESIRENLELIGLLKACYFEQYSKNSAAAQAPAQEEKGTVQEEKGAVQEEKSAVEEKETAQEEAKTSKKIRITPPPKSMKASKESMEPKEAEEGLDLDLDLDLDIDDLLNDASATLTTAMTAPTLAAAGKKRAIREEFEDKQCCYLMYHAVRLLHAQLQYLAATDRFAVKSVMIEANKEIAVLTNLLPILGIDSGSVELSLIKKEVIEVLSLLSLFCESCSDLVVVFNSIMKAYAVAKADPESDHFALLDVVFGLLYRIDSQSLWADLKGNMDTLAFCDAFTRLLDTVLAQLLTELDGYIKRLQAEKRAVNAAGLTSAVAFVLRALFGVYNETFSRALQGDGTARLQLDAIMDAVKALCEPTFAFATQLLRRAVDIIVLEDAVSPTLATFLATSPAYKAVECALFFFYSVITRDHPDVTTHETPTSETPTSETPTSETPSLQQLLYANLARVRSLLKPLSDMVITLDRALQVLEPNAAQAAATTRQWMGASCATFTTFSTVITTILINQKPAEVHSEDPAVSEWLNSTLLSRGYGRDMADPVRQRCLELLRGKEAAVAWYDAFRAKKKVNKLQQRFIDADPSMPTILRAVTAAYVWHSPSCYHLLRGGQEQGAALSAAYTMALQLLQHVNQLHQKENREYAELEALFLQRCAFLLDLQPFWYHAEEAEFEAAMSGAYQLLKNEKEIEVDEDEDEEMDAESIEEAVADCALGMAKKFVLSAVPVKEVAASMDSRSVVAENRALSFEYFSSLLAQVRSTRIYLDLVESITMILEQADDDGSVRKTHFMTGLEGSAPQYQERVGAAFASIIHSTMRKLQDPAMRTAEKMDILYALALPYLPSDAALLQRSDVLQSLSPLWSFRQQFLASRFVAKPAPDDAAVCHCAGRRYQDAGAGKRDLLSQEWQAVELGMQPEHLAATRSELIAVSAQSILRLSESAAPTELRSARMQSVRVVCAAGNACGGHVVLVSDTGMAFTYGDNDAGQCGRSSTEGTRCPQLQAATGACVKYTIVGAAAGRSHTLLLADDGTVLGCGSNAQHALGSGPATMPTTTVLAGLAGLAQGKIIHVAAGDGFSLFATKDRLFGCGDNRFGQLGADPAETPQVAEPTAIALPAFTKDEVIRAVAAGDRHVAVLSSKNRLFLMGANDYGQLGDGSVADSHVFREVVNIRVRHVLLGVGTTVALAEYAVVVMGDNTSGQLGLPNALRLVWPCVAYVPSAPLACLAITASSLFLLNAPQSQPLAPLRPHTESSLKSSYASWLLANLLFIACSEEQLELSAFSAQFLRIVLNEIYFIAQAVGDRCVGDEWHQQSPRSYREGSVGMFMHALYHLRTQAEAEEEMAPFTYVNQLLTLVLNSARKSPGLVKELCEEPALAVLLPLLVQLVTLHSTIATSSSCQYLYLDNIPCVTPLLLCTQNLISLLAILLPEVEPATVTAVLLRAVPAASIDHFTAGLPRKSEHYLLPTFLLRAMGKTIIVPYGPIQALIPAPYYARLIATKCTELIWTLLQSKRWNGTIMNAAFICSGMCVSVNSIVQKLVHQPIDYAALSGLYLLAGSIAFFAGLAFVPAVNDSITVTVGTLKQEGHVIMFRDRKRKFDWRGVCIIKLDGSKELAWVKDLKEMALVTTRVPIDSYSFLSRVFENYETLLNGSEINKMVRNSPIFCQLQEMALYSMMNLLQFPQMAPFVSIASVRCLVNFLHLSLPVQYATATTPLLKERQELIEGLWKLHSWESIRGSLQTTTAVDYCVNVWPPVVPSGMRRCNVCKFPCRGDEATCGLCGAPVALTLGELVESARLRSDSQKSLRGSTSIRGSISSVKSLLTEEESEELGIVRKWMFFENVSQPADAKCEIVGSPSWRDINIMKTQKQILKLSASCSLRLSHPFMGLGGGVYLNTWTLIIDLIVPDFASRDYTAILQTDPTNTHPASFFVRRDGSCGIGVYSAPGVIRPNCFHRLVICTDCVHHFVRWYVDGRKQGELSAQTLSGVQVLVDDRWSLDSSFLLGMDSDPACVGSVFLSAVQLRRKIVQDAEVKQIGTVSLDGPPEPSNDDVIVNLMNELHVPRSWCAIALSTVGSQSERAARRWIQENESSINRILLTEAKGLEKLGYPPQRCKKLILMYGSRQKALELLEANLQEDESLVKEGDLAKYIEELEALEKQTGAAEPRTHPGEFNGSQWTCCHATRSDAPPCSSEEGRCMGIISAGNRVKRGPHWKWGSQGNGALGTVVRVTNWDVQLNKGVEVRWDNGATGLYRWNVDGCFDVAVICEPAGSEEMDVAKAYGNDSALDNPSYEIVDDLKQKFKSSQATRRVRFPALIDATLPEIKQELCIAARGLASSFSRLALLNLLALTNENAASNKLSISSLFLDAHDDLFQSFLSAFLRADDAAGSSNPLAVFQKEISQVMRQEVAKAEAIVHGSAEVKEITRQRFYFWLKSFSRRILDNLLFSISFFAQPSLSTARKTLPLLTTTSYRLIARYPERSVSFWYPVAPNGVAFASVLKVGEVATLSLPPTVPTCVLDGADEPQKKGDAFAPPLRYDLAATMLSASGEQLSFWRMVPPVDFVAYGMVVERGVVPPALTQYVCIKRSLLSLGQAVAIEKANEVTPTPDWFWDCPSIVSHFYLTPSSQPPDSNLVFTLAGENDEQELGSLDQIGWMLSCLARITPDPATPMGALTPFVFKPEIIQGLASAFMQGSPETRDRVLNYITMTLRRLRANMVTPAVRQLIATIAKCVDTLYEQQRANNIFSPSFQMLVEVLVSGALMCYDSRKDGLVQEAALVQQVLCQQPYFQKAAAAAIVMEALCYRDSRPLPLELVMEPFMVEILVRLKRSLLFQSEHPYVNMLHRQLVTCRDATSVTLRFDTECCSEEDDVFAVFPNAETRNPILLVSGSRYSQLTTRAATNQFYLEFPFCQVGKLEWMRQDDLLAYNAANTIVGYRSHDAWWTVTTDKCVSSGIVSFTFCLRQLNRLNVFLGVSGKCVSRAGFLGDDAYSWGLMASGSIWYNSRKQQFCEPLKANDVVKLILNFSAKTLSVTVNGEFKGVAFKNIPTCSIMPGVSFFDAGDVVELVNYKLCSTQYSSSPIGIEYVSSESTKEESVQWLKRVPEKRLKNAREMSNMGFDVHMCVLALEATNDDMQLATDYVLSNMKELAQKTAHLIDSQNKAESEKEKEEKVNWFMNAFLEDEKQSSLRRLPWTCPYCGERNDFTQRNCVRCSNTKPDLGECCAVL